MDWLNELCLLVSNLILSLTPLLCGARILVGIVIRTLLMTTRILIVILG
jgi:hypothetical protein